MKLTALLLLASFSASAADLKLNDYDWTLTDISGKGLKKEALFTKMDTSFIKAGTSICSNRALMWSNDFKNRYDIDTGKIFLFYTKKKGDTSLRTWWYHVAPLLNEAGDLFVMDKGFSSIKRPLTPLEWLEKFAGSKKCKEIQSSETDLVKYIFNSQTFPHETAYGNYDCYYKITPHTIWTPEILAMNVLGVDADGQPVRVERPEIDKDELYQACIEATTSKFQYAMGSGRKKCKEYAGIN